MHQSGVGARVPLADEKPFQVAVSIIPQVIGVYVELYTMLVLATRRLAWGPVGKGTQNLSS
jgi:hypothetical protein